MWFLYMFISILNAHPYHDTTTCSDHLFCPKYLPPAHDKCYCGFDNQLTLDDINTLRYELRELMDNVSNPSADNGGEFESRPLIGTWTRLAFHDCAGGITAYPPYPFKLPAICDGCLNFLNPEHNGLLYALQELESVYLHSKNQWFKKFSRADMWMFAATMAVEYAQYLDRTDETSANANDLLPDIGYFCGRTDCFSSPSTSIQFEFPKATQSLHDFIEFMHPRFGFDEFDFVGLIGVHTLGRAHVEASGFTGPWVLGGDKLNNEFYLELKGRDIPYVDGSQTNKMFNRWKQIKIEQSGKFQWNKKHDTFRFDLLMMNVDMVNERTLCNDTIDINTETGEVDQCKNDSRICPFSNDKSQKAMRLYANSNQEWLNAFSNLFRTLIHAGYDSGRLCRVGKYESGKPNNYKMYNANHRVYRRNDRVTGNLTSKEDVFVLMNIAEDINVINGMKEILILSSIIIFLIVLMLIILTGIYFRICVSKS